MIALGIIAIASISGGESLLVRSVRLTGTRKHSVDSQITITLRGNVIDIRIDYPDQITANQEHVGWLRAWKSGTLKKLIEAYTWYKWRGEHEPHIH